MSVCIRVLAAGFFLYWSTGVSAEAPVQVESAVSRSFDTNVQVNGTVTSPRSAVLSTSVAGLVAELNIDEGYRVEVGQTLLLLDAELAQLSLEQSLAEVRQRDTELADAKRRFSQAQKVGAERGIARTEIESLRAEVASDEAILFAAQVAAKRQQALVNRHTLIAPFSGVISARMAELGEWVNPGDGLLQLVATDNLRFDFQVGQDSYAELSLTSPISITLDALPGRTFAGRIAAIVPVKNPSARTFLIRAVANLDGAGGKVRVTPGMSARGTVAVGAGRRAVVISRDALLRFPDGRLSVWIVDTQVEPTVVREQIVQAGIEVDGGVEIVGGLKEGDVVVVRGNESLRQGQAVSIVDSDQ